MVRIIGITLLLAVPVGCESTPVKALPATEVERTERISDQVAGDAITTVAESTTPPNPYWPHWRGENYDGIASQKITTPWPKEGLQQVWSQQIGIGFSSMALDKGWLFAMGWNDEEETVFCLEAASGKSIWKHTYPGKKIDNLHDGGPGATPTIDGDVVYTLGREGQLFCLKCATGEVVWQKQLPEVSGVAVPEWGFTSSPLVEGKLLIVDAGAVIAFDKQTGETVWNTEKFRPGYGTAAAFDRNGARHLAVLNNDCLLVVNAADGAEVARHPWKTSYATTSTTPIIHGDTIFISSGYGQGCALLKFQGEELVEVYDNKEMANHFNNSVLYEGHLYGIHGNTHNNRLGKIVCMDYATGAVKWSERKYGVGSLVVTDGKCVVLSDEGELVVCRASPDKYEELAKAKILDGLCWTVPVLAGGHVYARNAAGDLVCVKLPPTKE